EEVGAPVEAAGDRLRVGVDEQLARVEAQAAGRVVRAVDAVAVELARTDARHVAVPDVGGHLAQPQPLALVPGVQRVEQADLHLGRVFGIEGEVHAVAVPGGTERVWRPWQDLTRHGGGLLDWRDYKQERYPPRPAAARLPGSMARRGGGSGVGAGEWRSTGSAGRSGGSTIERSASWSTGSCN